ncbi:MAG: GGDEF domain-containing protein [Burkholderiales bacterium]|nr:MAG: GGDEF domain-containing protein [Burkholderiales bacterium]
MAGASFILAINLFIAALFALAFFLVAATNRNDGTPRWFALAYCCGLLYIGAEILLPIQINAQLTYTAGFAAFLGAVACVTIGIASRYRQPIPWGLVAVTAVLSIIANWLAYDIGRDSIVRMLAYQAPYALLQAVAAQLVWRSRRRHPMDVALLVLFCLSGLQFITKPLVAQWTGGAGDFSQSYISTTYALYSQSFGAILQVALGLLTLLMLVRDMLVEVTARSETDPLSSLLNRRGFEDRAVALLAAATQSGVPVTLVASDLDSFKSINDNFGHDTGDQVIIAFASLLASSSPHKAIISRIGGEEFAVLLPGTNQAAARLYAESLRTAFGSMAIGALPEHMRVTASFGVAEFDGKESLSELRRRADTALYVSKRGGRDRVSVAADPDEDEMPMHPLAGTTAIRRARTG